MSNPHDGFQTDAQAGWFRPTPQETFAGGDSPYKPGEFTRTCKWTPWYYGLYKTGCGSHTPDHFPMPEPPHQQFKYCPYCGARIEVVK